MPVPNTFAGATAAIPLSQLDQNFATTITLGNTAIQLGNTVTTLNNMTFANVTINSVATPITAAQGGTGLTSVTANAVVIGNGTGSLVTISPGTSGNVLTSNGTVWSSQAPAAATGNVTIGNTTITLGGTTSSLGNVTLNNCTTGNATSDSANVAGFIGLPQNSQNGAYNVVIGDAGKHIFHPVGQAAATYTIPANSNVAFTVGTAITFINMSANAVTIAVTSDVMYLGSSGTTGNRTLAQYGVATAVKITSTNWIISGTALT
jgi:hypothetical protein